MHDDADGDGVVAPVPRVDRDVGVDAVFVRSRQGPSTPVAVAIADRAVVVTPGLVAARYRGGVTAAEAAAAMRSAPAQAPNADVG